MNSSVENSLFSNIRDLGAAISNYESLKGLDSGRKVVPLGDGSFSTSWGYNKGLGWIIQMVSRNISYLFGYEATALGTKAELENLNGKTLSNLTGLVNCVEEKCKDSEFLISSVKTELLALRSVIATAEIAIRTLSGTYQNEGGASTAMTIDKEAEKCAKLVALIDDSIKQFSNEDKGEIPVKERVYIPVPLAVPKEASCEKTANELYVLFEKKLNSSPKIAQEIFTELLGFEFSFKDLKDIKLIRIGESDKISADSRIGKELDKWKEILSSAALENNKASFSLAFDEVYKPQAIGDPGPKTRISMGNVLADLCDGKNNLKHFDREEKG